MIPSGDGAVSVLDSPDPGLRIASLSIRPECSRRCTVCEGSLPSVNGWAPVQSLYAGNEQIALVCAHCTTALRKTEQAR
jgi:hypothetical protein